MNEVMFTICIPSYNRAYALPRCLDSLVKQTNKSFEVILVDDGSTDNTAEICELYKDKLPMKYIYKENGGKHTALNVGIKQAVGRFFIILDSDEMLQSDALEKMQLVWNESIPADEKEKFCGIMGKIACGDTVIGNRFPEEGFVTTYVDFHFAQKSTFYYGDCCECVRTDLLKQYSFPEPSGTKFVPEYYIYDQIGCTHKLYCTNTVLKKTEYLEDGITKNWDSFYHKNAVGILYGTIIRIDVVFNKVKGIDAKKKFSVWLDYWNLKFITKKLPDMPEVRRVSLLGLSAKLYYGLHQIKNIVKPD